jgi:hypothetical protein
MPRLIQIFLAALLICTQVKAATIETLDLGKTYILFVEGTIDRGDATKFRDDLRKIVTLAEKNDKGVIIGVNSQGGLIGEAVDMANVIRERQLPLSVTNSSECLSACFLMFLSAPKKLLFHGARIGVHSASNSEGAETEGTKATTVDFARIAKENGAPNSVIGKLVAAKPDEMLFLSEDEMKQMGAVFADDDKSPEHSGSPEPKLSGSVNSMPRPQPSAQNDNSSGIGQATESREQQDVAFEKYWSQKVKLSKTQHSGRPAAEKRCNKANCVIVLAYYDNTRRYIEIWKYDEPPKGDGRKLVCRQDRYEGQLTCTDWHDGRTFIIGLDHYIGANLSDPVEDFLRLFD